ncbi:LolA family protein [Allobacillus halotolerans]|uniref:Outer membrane lipoprotein carrier protein LolA n=1 Tax=Allobacillus halotolerans TaxID=570278 RepID=A0ABS6GSA5_9BACI|nr:outer membrane lipoprotein carrier protein LolA [Allobacillus halotolerans]MBU6082011.1 outer membrane lipoprotein carrier protein LolA [Allobacillus halotolerans]
MKSRRLLFLSLFLMMVVLLSACGEETVEDVVDSLEKQGEELSSFTSTVDMTMKTGEETQQYNVEVWHKKDNFYKVVMNNKMDEEGNQVILRNDEGVFVLTPSINKSYKFQNEWPKHHSQPYLYTSLIDDIKADDEREFKKTENYYIFTVKTNYKGKQKLPYQEIYFHKKSKKPALVKVFNAENESIVEVTFNSFDFDVAIEDEEFDTDQNLAEGAVSVPTMAELEEKDLEVYYPVNLPAGTEFAGEEVMEFDYGERVLSTFEGEKSFTLIQEVYESYPTDLSVPVYADGELVDLGKSVGHLANGTLEWEQDGMRFVVASESLTVDELVEVAQSVEKEVLK